MWTRTSIVSVGGAAPGDHRGFTLIEVMAVTAVVAVLLGITLSGMRAARSAAKSTVSLSNLKQNTMVIVAFASIHDDLLPLASVPTSAQSLVQVRFPDGTWFAVPYFSQMSYWHGLMSSLDGELVESAFSPWSTQTPVPGASSLWRRPSDYAYSQSFMTAPGFWVPGAVQQILAWRAVRTSEVRTPARKSMLSYGSPSWRAGERPDFSSAARQIQYSAVDGSASVIGLKSVTEGVPNSMYGDYIAPMITTAYGAGGVDVR